MATRSLTEVFNLMRNNALQNRHIFSEQFADDRMALVSRGDADAEAGLLSRNSRMPPEWVDSVEEIQFEISKVKQKVKDLSAIHDKHLNRPTLDDSIETEHSIEIATQETTQMFMRCQRLLQQISSKSRFAAAQEQKLAKNIVSSLARTLQELSTNFRKTQGSYLRRLQTREERSSKYFEVDLMGMQDGASYVDEAEELFDRGFTDAQLQMVEDNSSLVAEREKEIAQIVRSIQDLNEIFKDLAALIVDQGTILDRIDYNIEQTSTRVESGLKQLQKAEKHQKKNKKMMLILILFVVAIILVIILIAVKSR